MKKIILIFLIFFLSISFYSSAAAKAEVIHINLDSEINNAEFSFIDKSLTEAENINADFVIIEINSLGGFVDSALKIRDRILESEVKVISFVNGRAWSAAALIALAGEKLYISPSSSIGAAETRPNEEKYISALRKEFAATAERRNKNPQIAEAMVDASMEIEGLIEKDKLLTLTAAEALEVGIADFNVSSLADLAAAENINLNEIRTIEKTNFEKIMGIVSNPYASSLLLIIAFSALIFEALTPGFALGGTVGVITLLIFFAGHIFTGSIGVGIVILFIVGIILILAEIFIIPGFGIAGISGITAVLSSLFFIFPNSTIAINVFLAVVVFTLIIGVFMVRNFGSSRFWKKISLNNSSENYFSSTSKKDYLDQEGETLSKLRPAGTIKLNGERVDAVSEGSFISKGQKVKVISVSGSRVVVRKISEEE
ncbi:MAG: NfeD family protein [Bacillota bacterium]